MLHYNLVPFTTTLYYTLCSVPLKVRTSPTPVSMVVLVDASLESMVVGLYAEQTGRSHRSRPGESHRSRRGSHER